ncbi:SGNH/GDSL hydrolase family protein [Tsukamurella spumae]|uniref:SGNH/GDSL hydrolase family protein n=1 Tax=Tsukamurella spumae TaxID=44753 RepID=A0A846X364_9ACTN|nr:SGNH/GDSL hydrolase family protein [Tsukamurella spumae]NKY19593.1 SGNH/GDSL hydrolase family protein [Tsukamurella spumae]
MRRITSRIAAAALAVAAAVAVTPAVAGAANFGPRGAQYVSLGDSYIAAGSIPTSLECNAPDNVGHMVAAQMPSVSFADWSCSGSTSTEIYTAQANPAQIGGLSANTKYVSVSTGGNDEQLFADLATNCILGGAVKCTPQVKREASAKLDRLPARLDTAYNAIRKNAPNAKVVVLGSLRVLPDSVAGCFLDPIAGQQSVTFANGIQRRLNAITADAAARHGFTMVNQWSPANRSVCAPDGQRYVSLTGFGPGDFGTPLHPTVEGRKYTAGLIANAFR